MKLQVFRGSISSIPYFQTPQVFLCSLTTLVTRASRNDMVMRRPSQKLWVPEAHFLLKLVGKSCQPTAWNPETRQLESKLTLTILRTLDDVFFLKGDSLIITKRSESISTFRDEARCLANSGKPLALSPLRLERALRSGCQGAESGGLNHIEPPCHGHFFRDQWWNDDTLYSIDDPILKWLSWFFSRNCHWYLTKKLKR